MTFTLEEIQSELKRLSPARLECLLAMFDLEAT